MTKQIYLNILQKTTSKSRGWGFADNQHPHPAFGYILYTKDNSVISESSSYFYLNRSKDLTISSSCIIPLKAR